MLCPATCSTGWAGRRGVEHRTVVSEHRVGCVLERRDESPGSIGTPSMCATRTPRVSRSIGIHTAAAARVAAGGRERPVGAAGEGAALASPHPRERWPPRTRLRRIDSSSRVALRWSNRRDHGTSWDHAGRARPRSCLGRRRRRAAHGLNALGAARRSRLSRSPTTVRAGRLRSRPVRRRHHDDVARDAVSARALSRRP
jgi:hypothetical protein